uniref:Uncharacterized protein n=1 Tax=Eptatretus burgeri TaxID=7764 RepID=A0A8C4Q349_EPTBU
MVNVLKERAIHVFAIGIKNADKDELNTIASDQDGSFTFYVKDFDLLEGIVEHVRRSICDIARGPGVGAGQASTAKSASHVRFMLQNIRADSMQASWTPVHDATVYLLTWRDTSGAERPVTETLDGQTRHYSIRDLRPATDYIVRLRAMRDTVELVGVEGRASTTVTPGGVQGLRLLGSTASSLHVTWTPLPGIWAYILTWTPSEGFPSQRAREIRLPGSASNHEVTGLHPGTEYRLSLSAFTTQGIVGNETKTFHTASHGSEQQADVETVRGLRVLQAGTDYVLVAWEPVSTATAYRISWNLADGGPERRRVVQPGSIPLRLEGLNPGSTYTIRISTLQGNREARVASVIATTQRTLETGNFPQVPSLSVDDRGDGEAIISWSSVPQATGYRLLWRTTTGKEGSCTSRNTAFTCLCCLVCFPFNLFLASFFFSFFL